MSENVLKNEAEYNSLVQEGLNLVRQKYDRNLYVQRHIKLYSQITEDKSS